MELCQPPGALHAPCQSCSLPQLRGGRLCTDYDAANPGRHHQTHSSGSDSEHEAGLGFVSGLSIGLSPRLGSPSRFFLYHVCTGIPVAWVHLPNASSRLPHPSVHQEAKVSSLLWFIHSLQAAEESISATSIRVSGS